MLPSTNSEPTHGTFEQGSWHVVAEYGEGYIHPEVVQRYLNNSYEILAYVISPRNNAQMYFRKWVPA